MRYSYVCALKPTVSPRCDFLGNYNLTVTIVKCEMMRTLQPALEARPGDRYVDCTVCVHP